MDSTTARFWIEEVFDIPSRGGLLAVGKVLEGEIVQGMTLQDEQTRQQVRVIGLEFLTPRDLATGGTTLLLERSQPSPVRPQATLVAISSGE